MKKSAQRGLLYAAYLFTCLEDRGWSFGISLCMQLLGGMQLVSIEQFAESIAQMGFSGAMGRVVDMPDERKWGMIICLLGNVLSMIASCTLFVICLSIERTLWIYTVCLILGMIFCSSYRVFIKAERNLSSRDWVLVLVNEEEKDLRSLAKTNAILTALDQVANILSPLLLAALLSFLTLRTSCIVLAVCSLLTFVVKALLLFTLYYSNERLRMKITTEDIHCEECNQLSGDVTSDRIKPGESSRSLIARLSSVFTVLSTYYAQPVFPAALALALLYMTVLGFDGLAISYGESVGLPENILGFIRSFSSAAGVAGAIMYAVFERRFGVRKTGMIGMIMQQVFLVLVVISIWLPGSPFDPAPYFATLTWSSWWQSFINSFAPSPDAPAASPPPPTSIDWSTWTTSKGYSVVSILAFFIGIAAKRFGLWMTDLAITHIMQVATPESQRNTVFGVQNAICNTFSLMKDVLVIILPATNTFGICILISFGFACSSFASYTYYIVKGNAAVEKRVSRKPSKICNANAKETDATASDSLLE